MNKKRPALITLSVERSLMKWYDYVRAFWIPIITLGVIDYKIVKPTKENIISIEKVK